MNPSQKRKIQKRQLILKSRFMPKESRKKRKVRTKSSYYQKPRSKQLLTRRKEKNMADSGYGKATSTKRTKTCGSTLPRCSSTSMTTCCRTSRTRYSSRASRAKKDSTASSMSMFSSESKTKSIYGKTRARSITRTL